MCNKLLTSCIFHNCTCYLLREKIKNTKQTIIETSFLMFILAQHIFPPTRLPFSSSLAKKAARQSCSVTTGPQNQLTGETNTEGGEFYTKTESSYWLLPDVKINLKKIQHMGYRHTSWCTPWQMLSTPVVHKLPHRSQLLPGRFGGWMSGAWLGLPSLEWATRYPGSSPGSQTPDGHRR